jgi:DNA repair exonuclease SbcCD ATPase subunit
MSQDGGVPDGIDGTPVEAAVADILAANEVDDEETVRSVLDHVSEDGVVALEGFDETVSDVSKVVSTAETRAELASIEFEDAVAAAEPVADVDVVAARLDDHEAELEAVSARAAGLTDDLQAVVSHPDDAESLYEAVSGLRDVAAEAEDVQLAADQLQAALEDFQEWLDSTEARARELDGDADAVARSLDTLTDAVESLEAAVESSSPPAGTDPAVAWFDSTLRLRVTDLLWTDLRAELDALETLAARQDDAGADDLDAVADRLDELDARRQRLAADLEALARPAWREEYGDRVDDFEAELDRFEPPVSWGAVQSVLDEYRP